MEKKHLQLGDLVSLEGLEKPGEDVVKLELGGKKISKLGEEMSDLAGTIEDNKNVQVGQIAGLVEGLKKAMIRELSPEKAAELLVILKKRLFKKSYFGFLKKKKAYTSAEGIKWKDVEKKLQKSPEKMWSLQQMEETGGEPDIMDYDKKTGEYIFMDCSAESPEGRRNCVYDREGEEILKRDDPSEKCNGNAVSKAASMGIEILTDKEYRDLQTKGKFDKKTMSWLKTPLDKRKNSVALGGVRRDAGVDVYEFFPGSHDGDLGFRGSLRV